ncbi:MAG TPA: hypothetical protein VG838_18050 [Opitutaceae bacterium]|nr:hypothetical protein [Opitutaceae bacterium]
MKIPARPVSALLLAGALLLLSGCGSSQMSRIDANRALYESWPIDTQQAVLEGRVEPGMTKEMVRMAIGDPTEVTDRSAGNNEDEIWIYRKGGDDVVDPGMGMGGSGLSMGGSLGGLGVSTGRGMGTSIGTGLGSGVNLGMGGMSGPMPARTPVEEREIVFQDGVVLRADPEPK